MSTAEAGHPAWCDPQHCYVTDEKVRVHEQAPARWEDDTAGLRVRFESRLLDPGDDDTTYWELRIHDLVLLNQFFGILPLDTVRYRECNQGPTPAGFAVRHRTHDADSVPRREGREALRVARSAIARNDECCVASYGAERFRYALDQLGKRLFEVGRSSH